MPHTHLARLTQIDYDPEMAFVATRARPGGGTETIGVVRTVADPENETAELSIVVSSDLKRRGLGTHLLSKAIAYCRSRAPGARRRRPRRERVDAGADERFARFTLSESDEQGVVRISHPL